MADRADEDLATLVAGEPGRHRRCVRPADFVSAYATWWRRRWRAEVPTGTLPDTAAPDPYSTVDEHTG